jgi:hypothetical protein
VITPASSPRTSIAGSGADGGRIDGGAAEGWTAYLDTLEAVADALEAALAAVEGATDGSTDGSSDHRAHDDPNAPHGADDEGGASGRGVVSADIWVPLVPEVAVPLPAGPPPAGSDARRSVLLTRLVELTDRLERRQDEVAQRLAELPSRRPRAAERHAGALGGSLDLKG